MSGTSIIAKFSMSLRNILNLIRGHFSIFGKSMKHRLLLPAHKGDYFEGMH